jgi:tRNA(Ile)-lysidine synthase
MAGYEAPFAVAVSGGGDSMALMHLVKNYARKKRLPAPVVLTVDHGLRNASTSEARQVVGWAIKAGLKAHMLTRRGPVARSGIEAWARDARYRLMGNWLIKHQICTLLVGHSLDDQAETFLLRLARGSGLDGLSAIRSFAPWPVLGFAQLRVGRPLLSISREALRNYLNGIGQDWLDDPMNEDNAFDRVRIRKMVPALASAGLSIERIAAAAAHLARARETLEIVTQAVLARAVRKSPQGVFLDAAALAGAPREVGLRALASVLMAVSGQPYRPRFESLERLFNALAEGKLGGGATLHGCHIRPSRKDFASFSLLVRPESPRKTGSSANKGA